MTKMKRLAKLATLLLLSTTSSLTSMDATAAAYDLQISQRNAANTGFLTRLWPLGQCIPNSCIAGINGSTTLPDAFVLGSDFTITGTSITLTSPPVNADWGAGSGLAQILNKPSLSTVAISGDYGDLINTPMFATVAMTGNYTDLLGLPALFSGDYGDLTNVPSTFAPSAHTHAAADIVSGTLADARIPSLAISKTTGLQTALDAKFNIPAGTTAEYVRGDGTLATLPVTPSRSFSYTTRALNTCFQPSATRDTLGTYAVDIATVSTLLSGQVGTVFLETFTDASCTTGTQEVTRFVNGNTQALGLSVTMNQNVTGTLTGVIPAGTWARLRTANTTGTPTFTARPGQEVLL